MYFNDDIIKVNLNLYKNDFLTLDIDDVKTYEMHYKNTYTIINKIDIKNYMLEEILIKFQIANFIRIDGIQNRLDAYKEFLDELEQYNGVLIHIDKIKKILEKNIGKFFLKKLKINSGIQEKFIYKTKDDSIYFETYIIVVNQQLLQIEFFFYEEKDDFFHML